MNVGQRLEPSRRYPAEPKDADEAPESPAKAEIASERDDVRVRTRGVRADVGPSVGQSIEDIARALAADPEALAEVAKLLARRRK